MHNLKKLVKAHEISTFIVLTLGLSYLFWGCLYASSKGLITKSIYLSMYTPLYIIGGFMPSVVAIALISFLHWKSGIREIFDRLRIHSVKKVYYVFIFSFTIASIIIPKLICDVIGYKYEFNINYRFSNGGSSIFYIILYFFAIMFFGGGVNEEFGWRGFLLPRLQRRLNPFITSVILGIVWSVWHIPLFAITPDNYLIGNLGFVLSFTFYIIETIWLTTIFTWLYNRTKGSLLAVILFHTMDDTVLLIANINNGQFNMYLIILNTLRVAVFAFILVDMFKNPSNKVITIE
ncbi:CPBP family intramembrane glutamic endopeptidase [Clostridium sp. C8-1-8]|uniref:CPBP family intramembrane glutamic endopeptidase n=1 Tax=Clostridium sp. C8-1-8 TaxID=2698831 RepID=UPI00136E41A0|nr:CPBP family intramembrane glutamic endopeptidase [Clostridium sp. C8-1-8]